MPTANSAATCSSRVAMRSSTRPASASADRARSIANAADTKFLAFSVNKPMTAILVFQLIEGEKLGLDDRLDRFFPNLVGRVAGAITLRQLLTHTSGIEEVISRHRDRRITAQRSGSRSRQKRRILRILELGLRDASRSCSKPSPRAPTPNYSRKRSCAPAGMVELRTVAQRRPRRRARAWLSRGRREKRSRAAWHRTRGHGRRRLALHDRRRSLALRPGAERRSGFFRDACKT